MTNRQFATFVWSFYKKNRRTFPWRETFDPYAILVSEFMLQQTQTVRVIPKFREWLTAFPTISALARSQLGQVLEVWNGLGYNRRGKYLWESAKIIEQKTAFPRVFFELRQLPGVGEYTANAVLAFAFSTPCIVLETNIRTAIIHEFFRNSQKITDKKIKQKLAELLPKTRIRDWYYALMDYGNFLKLEGIDYFHLIQNYTKQSAFKGSRRYVRGFLLREALKHTKITLKDVTLPGYSSATITQIAKELANEGMIHLNESGIVTKI